MPASRSRPGAVPATGRRFTGGRSRHPRQPGRANGVCSHCDDAIVASSLTSVPRHAARRRGPRLVLVLLVLLIPVLAGGVGTYSTPPVTYGDELSDAQAQAAALAAKVAAQKAQLAKLQALESSLSDEIDQTKSDLAGVNADLAAVKAKVASTGAQVTVVRNAYNALVAQIADLDAQTGRIAMEEMVKASELYERKGILADRLRAAYVAGNTSLLETILTADSFADALTDVGYYMDIGDQDVALAKQIQADEQTLLTLGQSVADTRAAADDLRAQTAVQKAALDAKLADFKRAQAQLKTLQKETQRQLALQAEAYRKLKQNKVAAAALLAKEAKAQRQIKAKISSLIAQQYAGGNIPSQYNGTLEWPVKGIITQEFGCTGFWAEPPLGNCAHFHTGIDIAAPMYTPIHASGAGRVVYEGPLSDGAWVVIIAHSKSLVTMYAHVDNAHHPPIVRAGQYVSQGQVIAYVGMTGNTTGPHCHWGVELNGTWVNPRLFL